MRAGLYLLALMVVGLFAACIDDADQQTGIGDQSSGLSIPAAAPPGIDASVKSLTELQQQIKSHLGKVVVVDLWALW